MWQVLEVWGCMYGDHYRINEFHVFYDLIYIICGVLLQVKDWNNLPYFGEEMNSYSDAFEITQDLWPVMSEIRDSRQIISEAQGRIFL